MAPPWARSTAIASAMRVSTRSSFAAPPAGRRSIGRSAGGLAELTCDKQEAFGAPAQRGQSGGPGGAAEETRI
eukprot:3305580-Pyramimonas_sp.AAC.2